MNNSPAAAVSKSEQDAIALQTAYDQIAGMVNRALFDFRVQEDGTIVVFKDNVHKEHFFVLLTEFLASVDDKSVLPQGTTLLDALDAVCDDPRLPYGGSVDPLQESVAALRKWLDQSLEFEIHLPSLNLDSEIWLPINMREAAIIYGNTCKHSILHLDVVSQRMRKALRKAGQQVTLEHMSPVLDDFSEWFGDDLWLFYISNLARLLNDVRIGIFEYAHPEYTKSIGPFNASNPEDVRYKYDIPGDLVDARATAAYWNLMNFVRAGNSLHTFSVPDFLRGHPGTRVRPK